eukprot:1179298-Amphidinium_carterae.2
MPSRSLVQCEPCSVNHVDSASECDDIETCIVASVSVACNANCDSPNESCRRWIVDSGAGLDLISKSEVHDSELQSMSKCVSARKLRTANGVIRAEHVVTCHIGEIGHDVTALVLDKCPPVLSLGRRVAQGYSFVWDSENGACLKSPSGKVIHLRVENHVPILDEGSYAALSREVTGEVSACPSDSQLEVEADEELREVDCDDDHDVTPDVGAESSRSVFMKKGRCKEAVGTRLHELTHFPKNRHCRICREVLKVATPARRITPGQESLQSDSFGKVIHLDHVISGSECQGVNGETCALVILDQYSGFIGVYPMSERSGQNVVVAIRHFIGESIPLVEVKVRADNAKEFEYATRALGLSWYRSTPYRHQSNGKIERCVRSVCEMTRCALSQSGLQHGHWPYAMEHAALMRNVYIPYHTHERTPWLARFGEEFQWEVWPFGASMRALVKSDKQGKFEANAREALFLGYEFAPGYIHADYRVATLPMGSGDGYDSHVLNIRRTVDIVIGGDVVYPAADKHNEIKDCVIRYVSASDADDRTIRMLHEGLVDESGILTEAQKERGWTVHRFGDRLVKTPPRSTRPPDWTPEDWRSLPTAVRKAFTEIHKEKQDASTASGSNGVVCVVNKMVSFAGNANCCGMSVTLSELRHQGGLGRMSDDVQRIVIELCCEPDSLLGRRSPQGTLVVRVTLRDDLCDPESIRYLAVEIQKSKRPLMLWVSVPCTTGCTWLRTVPHIRRDPGHIRKAAYDKCLASNALTLVRCAHESRRVVCWEWPRYSDLWKEGAANELERLGFKSCDIDGCAFGLRVQGELVKKPWRIMTNCQSMVLGLSGKSCVGGHQHKQCRGATAKDSANYSDEMVDCVHHAFMGGAVNKGGISGIIKAAAQWSGPQNDATSMEERICAAYANTLLNAKLSRVKPESNVCVAEEGERDLDTVLRELEGLLELRSVPSAPQRTNVSSESGPVKSLLLGAYTRRGRGVTGACLQKKWLPVLRLIHEAAKLRGEHRRHVPYSAIQLNMTSPQGMVSHVDQNNVGCSDIISLGEYEGGRLRDLGFPERGREETSDQGGQREVDVHSPPVLDGEGMCNDHDALQVGEQPQLVDEGDHREHDDTNGNSWGAFITRQIWPHEAEFRSAECQKALQAELDKLVQKGTWDVSTVQETSDVKAGKFGPAAIGRVYAIMGEKHSEVNDPCLREYKARIVFQGNNIRVSDDVSASEVFKDVSNTPANMAIARTAIGAGLSVGMHVSLRDVSQAYLQSYIYEEGEPDTWVVLPRAWWPPEWTNKDGTDKFRCPCCKLCKALYGHPVSGRRWEQRLSQCLLDLGWSRSEENPGTWIKKVDGKDNRHACLVTYVDDLLLIGPQSFSNDFWRKLEQKLEFKEKESDLYRYLGANHTIVGGTMEVEMCGYTQKAVARFEDELGRKLRTADTPYVSDGAEKEALELDTCGQHAKTASSHIATLLFLARMSRPDIMTAVMKLSRWVSKWEHVHDLHLKRLFEYLKGTAQMCIKSCVQPNVPLEFIVWTDADLNGDPSDSKSTSGLWIEVKSVGSDRSWPITWNSKRQGGSAYATCESEIIALNSGTREEGIPLHGLVEAIVGCSVRFVCREDNAQAISAVRRGYSKKLRHLPRIHRISIGALNEMLCGPQRVGDLEYHETSSHRADIFTKPLERIKFQKACEMLGMQLRDRSREG